MTAKRSLSYASVVLGLALLLAWFAFVPSGDHRAPREHADTDAHETPRRPDRRSGGTRRSTQISDTTSRSTEPASNDEAANPDPGVAAAANGNTEATEDDAVVVDLANRAIAGRSQASWTATLRDARLRGGSRLILAVITEWQSRADDGDVRPSESSLWFARAMAEYHLELHDRARRSFLQGVLAMTPSPGAMYESMSPRSAWPMLAQLVPLGPTEANQPGVGLTARAGGPHHVYEQQLWFLEVKSRNRFVAWLSEVAADRTRPDEAMAVSIWTHLVVRTGPIGPESGTTLGPPQDWTRGTAEAVERARRYRQEKDRGGSDREVNSRWGLREQVLIQFANADSEHADRLRQIAQTLLEYRESDR